MLIIVVLLLTICATPLLLAYYLGYQNDLEQNSHAIETNCLIIDHQIVNELCYYDCDENTDCRFNCYDGYIVVEYHDTNNITYEQSILMIANNEDNSNVENYLSSQFPINSMVGCYYDSSNPSNVSLALLNTLVFYILLIIFGIIGLGLLLGWIIYEIWNFVSKRN